MRETAIRICILNSLPTRYDLKTLDQIASYSITDYHKSKMCSGVKSHRISLSVMLKATNIRTCKMESNGGKSPEILK